ncbi:beta-N-acetylglucosaminidase domain-containing protein [Sphingobacterium sp. SGL-16]|uniref:beta-N-acetylglucosaminidase domain-containing protein n=1 Tax=Sphingobacterium sp. SGL-16 TaxID=2710883 RepID=UPI0013E9EFC1|nr:beta-N-acetylglucosaminidase domain-containing protein [Sphingobacterium sp. SGL-16]NGM74036.1 O-GlcNAcase [Sphingobacterium sp. SGL-16]
MKTLFLILSICFPFLASSQTIYPIPHHVESNGSIDYVGVKSNSTLLYDFSTKNGLKVVEKKLKNLPQEGYKLAVTNKKIEIQYSTARGQFYAYKTLAQLLQQAKSNGKLFLINIQDQPDVAFRGTVEGFYGNPWSHEARIAQLRFYGDWKMNTYIYGPKDDPYHSSPKWREAYPTDEAAKLKELVEIANQNQVDFYWAIHPGKDIKWNNADSLAVLHKFQLMYDLGVRHFAVFFDDISGEGTKAEKQAGLLNYLQKEFIDKKKDVGALIMCPTEYNKGWSNPKEGTYLDILGDQLDKRIHVMWTGNTVIHDITLEGQRWVNQRIKRPSFVWWNYPVSDYVRNHLLLGESYGLDKDAKTEMSGFVTNPMDKPEASKVAIFSVANYSWNLKAYDSEKTWKEAVDRLYPSMNKAYLLFSAHNTDPGPSYHQYRRLESQAISSVLDGLTESLKEGKIKSLSLEEESVLKKEFQQFEPSTKAILANAAHQNLVVEIKPWLDYFAIQGKAALSLLEMNRIADNKDLLFNFFQEFQQLRDQMIKIDQTNNRNPYQPGIVTASRHVLPWMEQSYLYYHKLLKESGYPVKDAANQPAGKVYTNIDNIKALPVQNDVQNGNRPFQVLKLSRMLEYITFQANDYVGINITSVSKIREVKFRFDEKLEGIELQYSHDGLSWTKDKAVQAKFVRLINTGSESKTARLTQFEIIFE